MTAECYFCTSIETKYCGRCGEWLCDNHRKNYPLRMMEFIKKQMRL